MFRSCVRSLQLSYMTIPNVSSLYRDPKMIRRVFRLLGRGPELLADENLHIWNFLKGSYPRRARMQNKLEEGYKKAILQCERATAASHDTTPTLSRSSSTSSVNSTLCCHWDGSMFLSFVVQKLEERRTRRALEPRPRSPRRTDLQLTFIVSFCLFCFFLYLFQVIPGIYLNGIALLFDKIHSQKSKKETGDER